MPRQFKGKIELDIRDSVPDWDAFLAEKAPEGAPNVLVVLFDDTGLAAWEPFGGRIEMPTLKKLADNGLLYSQWRTTALCSPTRSTYAPEDGYHLSKDLADKAISFIREAVRAGQAVVSLVLSRGQSRSAPRAAGVHRPVQRQVRRRLRGLP